MTHILIAAAHFYQEITDELISGAVSALTERGATCEIVSLPGALEVPAAIRYAIATGKFDGYVALGCVIRGETSHYDTVCNESARALMQMALDHQAAIGNGILTVENAEQAWVRADTNQANKGGGAAIACLSLIDLKKRFGNL